MTAKVYTLELTTEELGMLEDVYCGNPALAERLSGLMRQARADREAADLRLPWSVVEGSCGTWMVSDPEGLIPLSKRAACLKAAAPELLEAVEAWEDYDDTNRFEDLDKARRYTERALTKVRTGIPE